MYGDTADWHPDDHVTWREKEAMDILRVAAGFHDYGSGVVLEAYRLGKTHGVLSVMMLGPDGLSRLIEQALDINSEALAANVNPMTAGEIEDLKRRWSIK